MITSDLSSLREKFLNEGWVPISDAFAKEFRIQSLRWLMSAISRAENDPSLEAEFEEVSLNGHRPIRKLRRLFWNDSEFWSKVFELSGIFDLARRLINGKPAIIYHASFLKPKLVGSPVGFHQDQALWSHDYPDAFNVWIALTDCNSQNGCLQLFSRSHLYGLLPHIKDMTYPWHPVVSKEGTNLREPIQIQMSAGDIVLWHRYLVHGSGPNLSEQDRLGMVVVFADASKPNFKSKDLFEL